MKAFTLGFALLAAASCAKTNTQTGSLESVNSQSKSANLDSLQMDPQLNVGKNFGANVTVDQANKLVTVLIKTCPPGAACVFAGPSFSAKIISSSTDECGGKVTKARTDSRPVDGSLVEITVTDNSHPTSCASGKKAVTVVELNTSIFSRVNGKELTTQSILTGQAPLK